jgi:hypothetical protein
MERANARVINVTKARERRYHFAAAHMNQISPQDLPMKIAADLRQAEAGRNAQG